MARTFHFGPLRLDVEFGGLGGPTLSLFGYNSTASVPGATNTYQVLLEERDPVQAAIEHVQKMRTALRYGPDRYARLVMMQERKPWTVAQTLMAEGRGLYSVASVVGDEVLAAAEQELSAKLQEAEAKEDEEAQEAEEVLREATKTAVAGMTTEYVLGTIRAEVTVLGMLKDDSTVFQVTLEAPNAPEVKDQVVSPNPIPSSVVYLELSNILEVLAAGPDRYAGEYIKEGEPAEHARTRAEAMHGFGMVVGAQAIQQALDAVKVEGFREQAQFEDAMLQHLEERHKVVKARLDELRRRRERGR